MNHRADTSRPIADSAPARAQPRRLLPFIMLVYVGLAVNYIDSTPYRTAGKLYYVQAPQADIGAPDERQHVNYIRRLARERAFPVLRPGAQDAYENYQSHQPPLYYLLCAPLSLAVGTENVDMEKWSLRLVNVLLGCVLLWCVYSGIVAFTGNEHAGVFAAAFVSVLPMFLALSSAVTNDVLLYLMLTWGMLRIAAGLREGWTLSNSAMLGLSLGLAVLTKSSGLVLLAPAVLAMTFWKERRAPAGMIGVMLLVAAAVATPWLVRNQLLYGDPLAITAFKQAFVGTLRAEDAIASNGAGYYWFQVAQAAAMSFWGIFSYFDIEMPYMLYASLTAVAAAVCAGWLPRAFKGPADERRMHLVNGSLLAAVLAVFIAFNAEYFQAQARYIYPAVFASCSAFSFGLWQWAHLGGERKLRLFWTLGALWYAAMVCVNLYVILRLLPERFAQMTGEFG